MNSPSSEGAKVPEQRLDDPARERCLAEPPSGLHRFAENFMLAWYDGTAGVGAWLHLGTWPDDFTLWEDVMLLALPGGDDVLHTMGYRHTPVEERPAGPLLSFTCVRPFERWRVDFNGPATRSTRSELLNGLARDKARHVVDMHLDIECVTPVWDARSSASHGSMSEQVWASDHYQQLLKVAGTITTGGVTYDIDTTGVRDHSRGQRGHAMDQWGGHTLIHLLFPSGRAIGIQEMYDTKGDPNFDMGYVMEADGTWHAARTVSAPRVSSTDAPRHVDLVVESDLGVHRLVGEVQCVWAVSPQGVHMSVGSDPGGPFGVFLPGHARWEWDGEVSYGLTERSFGARS
jgi:hypothetical protein